MADYTVDNMKLGPCAVAFDSVMLGGTKGGIKINIDVKKFQFKCDQGGEQVLKEVETGADVTVDMTLLELTSATLNKMCGFTGGAFSSVQGRDRLALAKVLTLTEIGEATPKTFTFNKAIFDPASINLPGTSEREVSVKFTCVKMGGVGTNKDEIFKFA